MSYKPPPADYYIAFVSDRDGSRDIYTMRTDGSNLRRVTDDENYETYLAWSPDATKIVYTVSIPGKSGNDIYIVDANGGVPLPLTDKDMSEGSPDWSPDGSTIAYAAADAGAISIFLINADGSDRRRLTPDSFSVTRPRWSPDGQWLAAVWEKNILAFSADGEKVAFLASSSNILRSPAWAPDWSQVAYVANHWLSQNYCIETVYLDSLWQGNIYCQDDSIDALDWSPDGTRILYTRYTDVSDLFIKEVGGQGLIQLTDAAHNGGLGRWSPIKLP